MVPEQGNFPLAEFQFRKSMNYEINRYLFGTLFDASRIPVAAIVSAHRANNNSRLYAQRSNYFTLA
jgi:hypothetical protein